MELRERIPACHRMPPLSDLHADGWCSCGDAQNSISAWIKVDRTFKAKPMWVRMTMDTDSFPELRDQRIIDFSGGHLSGWLPAVFDVAGWKKWLPFCKSSKEIARFSGAEGIFTALHSIVGTSYTSLFYSFTREAEHMGQRCFEAWMFEPNCDEFLGVKLPQKKTCSVFSGLRMESMVLRLTPLSPERAIIDVEGAFSGAAHHPMHDNLWNVFAGVAAKHSLPKLVKAAQVAEKNGFLQCLVFGDMQNLFQCMSDTIGSSRVSTQDDEVPPDGRGETGAGVCVIMEKF